MSEHDNSRSRVQFGRTTIDYAIERSPKRRTVGVAVEATKGVVITAPRGVAVERLDRIVKAKGAWIVNQLRRVAELEPACTKELVSGESFAYLGRNHRLRVVEAVESKPAKLERGWLVVPVAGGLAGAERLAAIEQAIREWYVERASERLDARAGEWARLAGVELAGVRVRDQQERWGSCDIDGLLRFNWRIIQAPLRLVDYVVAHEVVHVLHHDHGRAFWAKLAALMPDYERRKDELRTLGPRLVWVAR